MRERLSKAALAAEIANQNKGYKTDLESLAVLLKGIEIPEEAQKILNKYTTEEK